MFHVEQFKFLFANFDVVFKIVPRGTIIIFLKQGKIGLNQISTNVPRGTIYGINFLSKKVYIRQKLKIGY